MFDMTDRVVMIAGAAGNLGQAGVRRFRRAGARVVAVDHSEGRLPGIFGDLTGGGELLCVEGVDMTRFDEVAAAVDRVLRSFGRIDALFNTVGGFAAAEVAGDESPDTWRRMLRMNLDTTLNGCRAVVPSMVERGRGRIVNTAARAGFGAPAGLAAYAASKSAVLRLTESLAHEVKGAGVNVNCVVPGTIDTPQNRAAMPDADPSTWVEPEAVADVAVFLASEAARSVTGAAVPVYGRL
ncbi:MAG TPA: SDR family NAD(P)-dependent oxidoreductase [Candidatus Polarisedimenticolaceae bacterium]|nr:SDR family NAD(P)-dependent oxidoreductase [Candidatus Polarisedimenticolaceae bacterium]